MICEKNDSKPALLEQDQRPRETSSILRRTRFVEYRNPYVSIAEREEKGLYLESAARAQRGQWRKSTFAAPSEMPLDVEIGTGNGEFIAHHSAAHPERCVLGIERKFKPLVQSLKGLQRAELSNAAVLRYQADHLHEIFAPQEIDDIFLFFPDPWPKKRHHKHRLVNTAFLKSTFMLQRPGARFVIKTDNDAYYDWILEHVQQSEYIIEAQTRDLHQSPWNAENYRTQFERLWTRKGLKTKYVQLRKVVGAVEAENLRDDKVFV